MSYESPQSDVNKFSSKRCFLNHLDEYHGEFLINELSKFITAEPPPPKEPSETLLGEDYQPSIVPPTEAFEIIGTVKDPKVTKLKHVSRIIPKIECLPLMLTCGIVVLDISSDANEVKVATEYIELLKKLFDSTINKDEEPQNVNLRKFILISTIMTWGLTKPFDPDTPEMPFIDTDFRKRKPHPNYKSHLNVENEVILLGKKYKQLIRTTVVGVGVTYGGREDVLFYWFQKAWECEPLLPILGRGNNAIPMINARDLASIIYNLISDFPKKHYMLAVEQNITKQREIVKSLSRVVGSGMCKCIPEAEGLLIPEITQRMYDLMTLKLFMEPIYIVETMALQWTSEVPFAENIPKLMNEFKKERKLKPFKVVIYGPPLVGKTTLAKQICHEYGLIYISPETIIEDVEKDLIFRMEQLQTGELAALGPLPEDEMNDDGDEDADEGENVENYQLKLGLLQSGFALSEEEMLGHLRGKLLSHECSNRGWVLDGYPMNLNQCISLFEKGEEDDEVPEGSTDAQYSDEFEEDVAMYDNVLKRILPDIVVSLEATDDFICDKAMRQPEEDYMKEAVVLRRLNEFRAGDTRENTPLNFFDELDIHPLVLQVADHEDYDMKKTCSKVTLRMGTPCRYGNLIALIEAAELKEKRELDTLKRLEGKVKKELEEKVQREREERMEYWSELLSILREEEEAAIIAEGEPMRNYLINYIFPTLTPALLEIAKVRPNDPIDYLAEYLFKKNPSGKMLEPGYNIKAEMLLGKIKLLDDTLKDLDIKIDSLVTSEEDMSETTRDQSK